MDRAVDRVIARATASDFSAIYQIINDAAQRYHGVIPDDCWHEPYMSRAALQQEIDGGVAFWGYRDPQLAGVMGLQYVKDVALIRHAYVLPSAQGQGIGSKLLQFLRGETQQPLLIGTWAAAHWAIGFYRRHGFELILGARKDRLLDRYWSIPERQRDASVVLADVTRGAIPM